MNRPASQLGRKYVTEIDKVQCPICKFWYRSIAGSHLRKVHNLDLKAFKIQYPAHQYCCIDMLEKQSESAKKNILKFGFNKEMRMQWGKSHKVTKVMKDHQREIIKIYTKEGHYPKVGNRYVNRICKNCGKKFVVLKGIDKLRKGSKFCSVSCRAKWRINNTDYKQFLADKRGVILERINKKCEFCGKKFKVIYSHKKQKYCSMKCYSESCAKNKKDLDLLDKAIKETKL